MANELRTGQCSACGGRLFVKTSHGRKRCACYWQIHNDCIKPIIKHGEPPILDETLLTDPWTLTSRTLVGGDYTAFRQQVWRSLLYYLHTDTNFRLGFQYDYMDAGRLAEIHFARTDPDYQGYRDLVRPGLLVLVCGVMDVHNNFTPHLVDIVLKLREAHGKVTWVYTTTPAAMGRGFQPSAALLGPATDVVVGGQSKGALIRQALYGVVLGKKKPDA